VFCCVPREPWDFEKALGARFGAISVRVRTVTRSYGAAADPAAETVCGVRHHSNESPAE
jgi:hypothetical protein